MDEAARENLVPRNSKMPSQPADEMDEAAGLSRTSDAPAASATNAVLQFIRHGIRSGELEPGKRLLERELIDRCSVSRSAVREALRTLAADGTIQVEMHRGAVVRRFTREEMWAHHQIREVLEGLAASLAANRVEQKGYAMKLMALSRAMAAAVEEEDPVRYLKLNDELHRTIVAMSGNPSLGDHLERTVTTQLRQQASRLLDIERMKRSHGEHAAIIEAILSGDSAGAEAAMRRHIRSARRNVALMPDSSFGAPAEKT